MSQRREIDPAQTQRTSAKEVVEGVSSQHSPPKSAPKVPTGSSARTALPAPGTGSSQASQSASTPQDKTVISKRAPTAEPLALPTVGGPMELGRSLEGRQLGHYMLERFVGGGGMGAVFRATDTKLSRIVAVKVMARDRTDDDTLRRFQNEAQSAARLDHPNIARVHYVGEDEGLNYIVFEYIEGVNIRELVVQRGPLDLEEAINYTLQVAEALEHAYQRDVVHRDIKPSNVLVMANGHVKLVDMGLARMHQVEASNADLTATGVTLGTFDYISPEQARDPRSADVRSDLYSLGCTLFFMLTGRPPFPEGTVLQKLLSHSSDPPPDVRVFRPELSEDVGRVVQRLLAKQPAQRYQSPSELIGALLLLADGLGLDRVARKGMVWVAQQESGWSVVERQLPWAVPSALFIILALLVRWSGASSNQAGRLPVRPVYSSVAMAPATPNSPHASPSVELDGLRSPELRPVPNAGGTASPSPDARRSESHPPEAPLVRPSTGAASPATGASGETSAGSIAAGNASPVAEKSEVGQERAATGLSTPAALAPTTRVTSEPQATRPDESNAESPRSTSAMSDEPYRLGGGVLASDARTAERKANEATAEGSGRVIEPGLPADSVPPPMKAIVDASTTPSLPPGPPATPPPSPATMPAVPLVMPPARATDLPNRLIKKLVVGDAGVADDDDPETRRFDRLDDAFRAAVELTQVESVELHYDGPRESRPFDVSVAARRIAVRAGTGFRPTVLFRPAASPPPADRWMMRVLRNSFTWEGIPIELELPDEPSDGWAVFHVDRAGRVDLSDVVLTIREGNAQRRLPNSAAFFRLAEPVAVETMMDMRNMREAAPATLALRNCIARGPGSLVKVPSGVPFRLSWQQGLFTSTCGLIETEGARSQPQPSEVISVDLARVTLAIGRPLCLMRLEPETRFPLELVGKFQDCIFTKSTAEAVDAAPLTLVEQQYGIGVEAGRYRPYWSGSGNYYPDNAVLLRIGQLANPGATLEYTLLNRHEARLEKWYDEQPSAGAVMWKRQPASDVPVEKQSKNDFVLDDSRDNPAAQAGFDPQQLPE